MLDFESSEWCHLSLHLGKISVSAVGAVGWTEMNLLPQCIDWIVCAYGAANSISTECMMTARHDHSVSKNSICGAESLTIQCMYSSRSAVPRDSEISSQSLRRRELQ